MRIFKEEQRFTQLWLIVLIIISVLVPIGIIIGTYIKNPDAYSIEELVLIDWCDTNRFWFNISI